MDRWGPESGDVLVLYYDVLGKSDLGGNRTSLSKERYSYLYLYRVDWNLVRTDLISATES